MAANATQCPYDDTPLHVSTRGARANLQGDSFAGGADEDAREQQRLLPPSVADFNNASGGIGLAVMRTGHCPVCNTDFEWVEEMMVLPDPAQLATLKPA